MVNDIDLVKALKTNSNGAFTHLYKSCYPVIAGYIEANGGSEQDAEDVFQETVIILLDKIKQPGFELTSSLKTFLFSIARNLWLKHVRDRKPTVGDDFENIDRVAVGEVNDREAKSQKAHSLLEIITVHCKRILMAIFFAGEPIDKLMARMGWKNKHTAANQKYKCLEQAKKKNDE